MKIVVDSNIIFSSLISGKTFYMDFFSQNEAYAPDFLFEEIKGDKKGDRRLTQP
jgi:predicted nucleic acid-binding protein